VSEILLDAIARSDGTRASVTEQLRRTKVRNGVLGDVSWDARGDLVEAPVAFMRLSGEGFAADRMVWVRRPS
jgi:ABC-type branched-subunit amino acid transport system substrate-binding protein